MTKSAIYLVKVSSKSLPLTQLACLALRSTILQRALPAKANFKPTARDYYDELAQFKTLLHPRH